MLSITVNDREHLAPQGFGEITIAAYAAFMATVHPLAPPVEKEAPKTARDKLAAKIRNATDRLRGIDLNDSWLKEFEYRQAFVGHWFGIGGETLESILPSDIEGLYNGLNLSWSAWEPVVGIKTFRYAGKQWEVDYSLDALGSVKDASDMQLVMARICRVSGGGKYMHARKWGELPLSIAASIMTEIKRRHSIAAPIVGANILQSLNIVNNGK